MEQREIYAELKLSYNDLITYLQGKYGRAQYDYFTSCECKSKNKKVFRTSLGLYCHHADEDKGINLSSPMAAQRQPFEWQGKDRLVYCNLLEHLILHIKIAVLRQRNFMWRKDDISQFFSTGGIYTICGDLNDMYIQAGTSIAWRKRCFEEIKENYTDYITLVKALLTYIDRIYYGDKNQKPILEPGNKVHYIGESEFGLHTLSSGKKIADINCDCVIMSVSKLKDEITVKLPTGEIDTLESSMVSSDYRYPDAILSAVRSISCGYREIYESVFNDIVNLKCDSTVMCIADILAIDNRIPYYAKYSIYTLPEEFGSHNVGIYLDKALPMYCDAAIDFYGKKPKFWRGSHVPAFKEHLFYIVRIKTDFDIKDGAEPFVRYRENDPVRRPASSEINNNNHNYISSGWLVLSTSRLKDSKCESAHSPMRGGTKNDDNTVILTLGREDFLLFKDRYDIYYMEVLDGCIFVDE